MHCYQGKHVRCWYGPGHWFLVSQLRYHHHQGETGDRATLVSDHRHHTCCGDHRQASVGWHWCARHHHHPALSFSDAL
jgi:hypothetical protein